MGYLIAKFSISAFLIVLISEVAKCSTLWGGVLASLPVVSILAFIWTYQETKDVQTISSLSFSIFWLVIPSLVLFIALPWLLKRQLPFYAALSIASLLTVGAYYLMLQLLQKFGMKL